MVSRIWRLVFDKTTFYLMLKSLVFKHEHVTQLITFLYLLSPTALEGDFTADTTKGRCKLVCTARSPFLLPEDLGSVVFSSIFNLNVLKKVPVAAHESDTEGVLLASVTYDQPTVMRETDDMSISGNLDVEGASFQIHFRNENDCLSEYICQADGLDTKGRRLSKSKTVTLQPEEDVKGGRDGDRTLATGVLLKLLTLVQQLDKNVAVLTKAMDGFEDKVASLQKALGYDMMSVESRLRDKLDSIGDKLNDLENRYEDKTSGNGSSNASNVCQLEVKISREGESHNRSDANMVILTSLEKFRREFVAYQNFTVEAASSNTFNSSELIEMVTNNNAALLASVMRNFSSPQLSDPAGPFIANLTETIVEALAARDLPGLNNLTFPRNNTCVPSSDSPGDLEQLVSLISNNTRETQSSLDAFASTINETIRSTATTAVGGIISPKICAPGMSAAVALNPYPYPVVHPSQMNGLAGPILCDSETDGGGWIIVQRRVSGGVDFNRTWAEYKRGFGGLDTDFWIGNDILYNMTSSAIYELRFDLRYEDKVLYARYATFSIGNEKDKYKLKLGDYVEGNAGDSYMDQNGMKFSTVDQDNDLHSASCAIDNGGGWWFSGCGNMSINGIWDNNNGTGLEGDPLANSTLSNSFSFTEMKIRKTEGPVST